MSAGQHQKRSAEQRIRDAQMSALFNVSARTTYIPLLVLIALGLLHLPTVSPLLIGSLIAGYVLLKHLTERLRALHLSMAEDADRAALVRRYAVLSTLTGAIWGAAALFFDSSDEALNSLRALTIMGVMLRAAKPAIVDGPPTLLSTALSFLHQARRSCCLEQAPRACTCAWAASLTCMACALCRTSSPHSTSGSSWRWGGAS